jgi:hypothetical protein
VPAYALDMTIKQRGNRLTATCGVVARYLARLEDCELRRDREERRRARQTRRAASAGLRPCALTLKAKPALAGSSRRKGEHYYPSDVTLRRLKKGEKPPYVADEEDEQ